MSDWVPPVIAASCVPVSFFVAKWARSFAVRRQLLDRPNDRSAHALPTPRLGGIGVMAAFLTAAAVYALWANRPEYLVPLAATAVIACLGLVDDVRPISARFRLGVQVIAATMVMASRGTSLDASLGALRGIPALVAVPLCILFIVWLTNLYNFMDGIDGLAGGQAVFGAGAIAAAAASVGASETAWFALFLAAAAAGFLFLNFPPAKIFMGDAGSTAIGFFLGCVPFLPAERPVPVDVVTIAVALFVFDATSTLLRRVLAGERLSQAHRSHWYQRPLAVGVSHRAITLAAYVGMGVSAVAAVAYSRGTVGVRAVSSALTVLVFLVVVSAVRAVERGAWRSASGVARPDA